MAQNKQVFALNEAGSVFEQVPGQKAVPVLEWETTPEGKRQPSDRQERDGQDRRLWEQVVLMTQVVYGRDEPELVKVRWAGEPTLPGAASGFPAPASKGAGQ